MPSDPFILIAEETGTQGSELRIYPDGAVVVTAPEWGPDREDGIEFKPEQEKLSALLRHVLSPAKVATQDDAASLADLARQTQALQRAASQSFQIPQNMSGSDLREFLDLRPGSLPHHLQEDRP